MDQEPDNVSRTTSEANTTTPLRRGKVLLILPYFGCFGPWFPLYLHGLARQHTIDLLLLSDAAPPALPPNARRVEMTFDQLREVATAKLGTPVRLHRLRNICDLKPAYGIVFEDFIRGTGTGRGATRTCSTATWTGCSRRIWMGRLISWRSPGTLRNNRWGPWRCSGTTRA